MSGGSALSRFGPSFLFKVHSPMAIPTGPLIAAVIPRTFLIPITVGPMVGTHLIQFSHVPAVERNIHFAPNRVAAAVPVADNPIQNEVSFTVNRSMISGGRSSIDREESWGINALVNAINLHHPFLLLKLMFKASAVSSMIESKVLGLNIKWDGLLL